MQAMSERVAALARLVAAVERGEGRFAHAAAAPRRAEAAPRAPAALDQDVADPAAFDDLADLPPASRRPCVPAAGLGFARGRAGETEAAAGFTRAGPPTDRPAAPDRSGVAPVAPAALLLAARRREAPRLALGVQAVDDVLGGGLDPAGLHEVHAAGPGDEAAAAGFVAALCALSLSSPSGALPPAPDGAAALSAAASGRAAPAMADADRRLAAGRGGASPPAIGLAPGHGGAAVAWIETRFSAAEDGLLWPAGLEDLGLDPARTVRVSVGRVVDALAAAEEALACDALAATVLEIRGPAPALDLVALRRLTLAARARGRPCLLLRTGATPQPTPALTRWSIAARPAGATGAAAGAAFRRQMGLPAVTAALTRQRAGRTGAWTLEWCADVRCFREPLPQPALSLPGDRPADPVRRRAG